MTTLRRSLGLAGATGLALAAAVAASPVASAATTGHRDDDRGAVFVQNDALTGNQVYAYHRGADGALTQVAGYATGGVGGRLDGAGVDFTASAGRAGRGPRERRALRGERGERLAQRLRSARRPAHAAPGRGHRRHLPGERHRARRPCLRAQRPGRRQHPGIPERGRAPAARAVVAPRAGSARDHGGRRVHPHARAGRLHPRRAAPRRDHEGREQQHRRVRARPVRAADRRPGRAGGERHRAVRRDASTPPGTSPSPIDRPNAVPTYAVGASGALTPLGVTPTGQRATCWIDASGNLLAASNAGSGTVTTLRADAVGHHDEARRHRDERRRHRRRRLHPGRPLPLRPDRRPLSRRPPVR